MRELDSRTIEELTIQAENGNGCPFYNAVNEMGYEERYAAMRAVMKENGQRRATVKTDEFLMWELKNDGVEVYIGIFKGVPDSVGELLYEDRLDTYSGKHFGNCFDRK